MRDEFSLLATLMYITSLYRTASPPVSSLPFSHPPPYGCMPLYFTSHRTVSPTFPSPPHSCMPLYCTVLNIASLYRTISSTIPSPLPLLGSAVGGICAPLTRVTNANSDQIMPPCTADREACVWHFLVCGIKYQIM